MRYARGRITVLDRAGLEARTCECYAVGKHRAAGQPGAGVDDEVADNPVIVLEVEVFDVPDLAVGGIEL